DSWTRRCYARTEGKVFQFLNAKCESAFLSKRNPQRKHKKGQSEEVQKKRTRGAVKFQRAITGASLANIMAKRNQKPEVRKPQEEQAIRASKEHTNKPDRNISNGIVGKSSAHGKVAESKHHLSPIPLDNGFKLSDA
uniref:Large ribosomal subunit protein eL24 n=1 Tax=Aotus nancymaae TaxID=37293 RepID=A0A2K5F2E8_AOTNA